MELILSVAQYKVLKYFHLKIHNLYQYNILLSSPYLYEIYVQFPVQ